jgi:hypothetical protein
VAQLFLKIVWPLQDITAPLDLINRSECHALLVVIALVVLLDLLNVLQKSEAIALSDLCLRLELGAPLAFSALAVLHCQSPVKLSQDIIVLLVHQRLVENRSQQDIIHQQQWLTRPHATLLQDFFAQQDLHLHLEFSVR